MNKSDLIDAVAKSTGLPKTDVNKVVNAFIETITDSMRKKVKVTIPGFAVFKTSIRKARKGRNPSTGAEIDIAEKTVVNIKAGSTLSEAAEG